MSIISHYALILPKYERSRRVGLPFGGVFKGIATLSTYLAAQRLAAKFAESLCQGRKAHDGGESVSIDANRAALVGGKRPLAALVCWCTGRFAFLATWSEQLLGNGDAVARNVSQNFSDRPDDAATTASDEVHPRGLYVELFFRLMIDGQIAGYF